MMRIFGFTISIIATLLAAPAGAADIKVISAGAVRGLIGGMIADYSRQTGHKFDFKVGTTGQLRAIIASGEPADLIIASAPLMAELEQSGKMLPGKPRRSRARRHRRRHPRGRDRARPRDARGLQAGAHRRALGRLQRSARGRAVRHSPRSACWSASASPTSSPRRRCSPMAATPRSRRSRRAKPRSPSPSSARSFAIKGARLAAPVPEALQLYSVYAAAIPGEQHRSGRRARLHRGARRAGDGGALEGGGLRAAEVAQGRRRPTWPARHAAGP